MPHLTDPYALYVLTSLAWFSLTDLRYRTTPGVEFFFWGVVLLGVFTNPLRVGAVLLSVAWVLRNWPSILMLPLILHPSTWMILLIGTGYRKGRVGGGDLLALAGIACLFEWYVPVLVWMGVLVWREWWNRRWGGPVPALPGMFIGVLLGLIVLS